MSYYAQYGRSTSNGMGLCRDPPKNWEHLGSRAWLAPRNMSNGKWGTSRPAFQGHPRPLKNNTDRLFMTSF